MDQDVHNPIIRARVTERLKEKQEGQTVEELAEHIITSEASVRMVLEKLHQEGRATLFGGKWTFKKSQ
jgi:hypothetical protein